MIHADFFSGIGMWALAARWTNWRTVSFCEKDKFCQKVLKKNFPSVPVFPDIFTTDYAAIKSFYRKFGLVGNDRRIDLITASTPCQPFSNAGQQKGSGDERHLFPQILRVISEVKPRWVVIENVRGLLGIENGDVFEAYHAHLESEGYAVQSFCIPASAVNAPHRRDRMWIVANSVGMRELQPERLVENIGRRLGDENTTAFTDPEKFASWGLPFGTVAPESRSGQRDRNVADTAGERLQIGGFEGVGQLQTETGKGLHDRSEFDDSKSPTDVPGDGIQESERKNGQPIGSELLQSGLDFERDNRTASDSISVGRQNFLSGRESSGQTANAGDGYQEFDGWQRHWLETAIDFCRVDDGLPDWLDASDRRAIYNAVGYFGWQETSNQVGFDCRKVENVLHRTSRLKALGNAIVPQIAFEIFKAIEQAENYSIK